MICKSTCQSFAMQELLHTKVPFWRVASSENLTRCGPDLEPLASWSLSYNLQHHIHMYIYIYICLQPAVLRISMPQATRLNGGMLHVFFIASEHRLHYRCTQEVKTSSLWVAEQPGALIREPRKQLLSQLPEGLPESAGTHLRLLKHRCPKGMTVLVWIRDFSLQWCWLHP